MYSIEPHGADGSFALYYGRDLDHHGDNLCKLSEFDACGEETRQAIVAALNAIELDCTDIRRIRAEIVALADYLEQPGTPLDNAQCRHVIHKLRQLSTL